MDGFDTLLNFVQPFIESRICFVDFYLQVAVIVMLLSCSKLHGVFDISYNAIDELLVYCCYIDGQAILDTRGGCVDIIFSFHQLYSDDL